jgi:hypothetical protein
MVNFVAAFLLMLNSLAMCPHSCRNATSMLLADHSFLLQPLPEKDEVLLDERV